MATSAPGPSPPPPTLLQQPGESPPPPLTPTPLQTGADPAATAARRRVVALATNDVRLESVVTRIEKHFRIELSSPPSDLVHLVFCLARGIDYALSYNEIPAIASRLPSLIKQVYQFQNDASLQPAMMVLLIAVKNACTNKWFPAADANELLNRTNEHCWQCSRHYFQDYAQVDGHGFIATERFYPHLQFHHLICSLEAKTGYDILMADFHIQRNYPPDEKICLLVVQTDNLETSSCITNPQHVNFLINGKAVERRTNVSMDTGPQFPTDISKMLKYGTNIVQAVGYFNGPCIIAIAFMSKIANPCAANLEDYVYRVSENLVKDSEVIEGPSRIALNCPISFKRIGIPVKGHHCKHYQCFDYDNFMEMNSWKPSWRCPCCNTPTNCMNLRIDQKIAKILQEVGDDVSDIVIFADGSWKVFEDNECLLQETIMEDVRTTSADVVDRTMDENFIYDTENNPEVVPSCRTADTTDNSNSKLEDRKPIMESEGIHIPLYASEVSGVSTVCTQAVPFHTENDLRSGNLSSTSCSVSTTSVCANSTKVGTLESLVPSVVLNPIQTNVVSPVHNQGYEGIELPQTTVNFQQVSVAPSVLLNPIQGNAVFPAPSQGPTGFEHLLTTVNFQQVPFVPNVMLNPLQTVTGSSALSRGPAVSELPHSTVNFQQIPVVPSVMLNPTQTDAFSPTLNQGPAGSVIPQTTVDLQLVPQVTHPAENMQLQSSHVRGSTTTNEARRPPIPRYVTRIPISVQALPAQTSIPRSSQRMHTAIAGGHGSVNGEVQIDGLLKTSNVTSASIQPHSIAQEHRRHVNASSQYVVGLSTPNLIGSREPRGQPSGVGTCRTVAPSPYYRHPHRLLSQTIHHYASPSSAPQSSHIPSIQIRQASHNPAYAVAAVGSNLNAQHAAPATALQTGAARIPSSARVASIPTFNDTGGTMLSSGSGLLADLPNDQDWRPLGRMRGSLTGSAYQAALNRYLNPSSTQSQRRPFSVNASSQIPVPATSTLHSQAPMIQQANIGVAESGNQPTCSHGFFDTGHGTTYY